MKQSKMANSVGFAYICILYLLTFWGPFKDWPYGSLHCPVISCRFFHLPLRCSCFTSAQKHLFCSSDAVAVSTDLQEHHPLKVKNSWIWRFFLAVTFLRPRWQINAHLPRAVSFYHLRKINEYLDWLGCMFVMDFPGPTQEASWIPRRNSRILPQLAKNHVVPPSSQDEALSRYSVSGEVPR